MTGITDYPTIEYGIKELFCLLLHINLLLTFESPWHKIKNNSFLNFVPYREYYYIQPLNFNLFHDCKKWKKIVTVRVSDGNWRQNNVLFVSVGLEEKGGSTRQVIVKIGIIVQWFFALILRIRSCILLWSLIQLTI